MRKRLVAGNWKMNGSLAMAGTLVDALKAGQGNLDLLVCPPFPYLAAVGAALKGSKWLCSGVAIVTKSMLGSSASACRRAASRLPPWCCA